jgi:prepilin peptidase CpaA
MTGEILIAGCGALLALALAVAAGTDLAWRIIPNRLNLAIALTAPLAWWAQGMSLWPDIGIQLAVAAAVFIPFVIMFNFGAIGGGDVKLLGALALWIAPRSVMPFLWVMAVVGGVLAAAMLIHSRLRQPVLSTGDAGETPVAPEVPYGVAIAIAGWWVIYQQYFNHFAAQAAN